MAASVNAQEDVVSVAVFPMSSSVLNEGEINALTDVLRSEIGKNKKYQVMERSQISQILNEQGFQQSGACDETSCFVEMGQLLGANYIIIGNVGQVGKTYSVNARVVDIATSKIVKDVTKNHKGAKDDLLTKVIQSLGSELVIGKEEKGNEKKRKRGPIIGTIVGVTAAAIAVPVIIILTKDDDSKNESTTIEW